MTAKIKVSFLLIVLSFVLFVGTVAAISADMNRQVLDISNKALNRNALDISLTPRQDSPITIDRRKTIADNLGFFLAEDDKSIPPDPGDGGGCQGTSITKCSQDEKLVCDVQCHCNCVAIGEDLPGSFGNPDPVEYVHVTVYETQAEIGFVANGFNPGDQITVRGGLDGSNVEKFTITKSVLEINSPGSTGDFLVDGLTPYTKYWFKISSYKGEHFSGFFRTLCKLGVECNGAGTICKIGNTCSSESQYTTCSEKRNCYPCGSLNEPCCAECAEYQACDNPYTCQMDKCVKQSDDKLSFSLPESIYLDPCENPSLDADLDGLKDNFENALADAWRPYFIYDEGENDQGGLDIDDNSLQSWEPRVFFQVRPIGGWDWPRRIVVKWAFLYRLDGGYRGSNTCLDWHYGDTQSGSYELSSSDGVTWHLDDIDLWSDVPLYTSYIPDANDPRIEWTGPRSTYWGEMDARPSPIVHASAGKHHQYMTAVACEGDHDCDDDCDGGMQRLADLTPLGYFTNVGEPNNHPSPPFVTDLGPLGYPGEQVWYSSYQCKCSGMGAGYVSQDCFTGGLGSNWEASGGTFTSCTIPSPVYKLFSHEPLTPNPG